MSTDTSATKNYSLRLCNNKLFSKTVRSTGKIVLLFERIVRHRRVNRSATQTYWIFDINIAYKLLKYVMIMCSSSSLAVFNPTQRYFFRWVPSKSYSQGMFPRHFFEEEYRVLSGSNREASAEVNQVLS